jgi:tetratricopeptide (TPR) repeat protein
MGDEYGVTRAEIGLGHLAIIQERFEDAAAHLGRAEALLGSAGEDETVQVYMLQALVEAQSGRLATAFERADKALSLARETGVTEQEAECWRVLGILHGRADQWNAAERALQSSLDVSMAAGDRYQTGLTLLERARLRLRQCHSAVLPAEHNTQNILDDLEGATERFATLGAQWDLDQALAAQTELYARVPASS